MSPRGLVEVSSFCRRPSVLAFLLNVVFLLPSNFNEHLAHQHGPPSLNPRIFEPGTSAGGTNTMPQRGQDRRFEPVQELQDTTNRTCRSCHKILRNKSGLTQHKKRCPVILETRFRRQFAAALQHDDDPPQVPGNENPPNEDWFGGDGMDIDHEPEGGGQVGGDGGVGKVWRDYHEGLSGA